MKTTISRLFGAAGILVAITIAVSGCGTIRHGRAKQAPLPPPVTVSAPAPATATNATPACAVTGIVTSGRGTAAVVYITTGTNGVGITGGLPVLINNACNEDLWTRFKRTDGPGAVKLPVPANTFTNIVLLEGSYEVSWGKPKMGLPVGQKPMEVSAKNLELVVGKGEFVATLDLTPQ